jgi:hypothetical protein
MISSNKSEPKHLVDGPYNKFLTTNISKTRRVYDRFHVCFNTNKVPRVVLVFLLVGTHLG